MTRTAGPSRPDRPHARPRWQVFLPAAAVVLAFTLYAALFTERATDQVDTAQETIVQSLGWYYVLIVAGFVIFVIVLALSRLGDVTLGPDDGEPEFSLLTWLAMLFAAGMGIGLVFWGVAEPLSHLVDPRPGNVGPPEALAQESMIQTFLHWGLQPWAIYAVLGLAVAYAAHRRGRPISIRWTLEPVLGRFVQGWVGDLIDIIAIVGTLFGVATSLGLGALQIAAGMSLIGDIDPGVVVQVALIIGITLVAVLSVVTGLHRGIKWLSQANVSLMGLLLIFVLVAGPTLFLLREFVQSLGLYLQNLVRLSFDVNALQGAEGATWAATWTTFYWGWWMSWAPFVGIFIARISRGRTVRQFIAGVLLVPPLVSFLWFAVLGGAGIHHELFGGGGIVEQADGEEMVSEEGALFGLLDTLPAATAVSIGVIVLIGLFFVTSSDSGSLVVDMLASGGNPEPPTWSRVFWAVTEGAVAIALLLIVADQDGLAGLQTAVAVVAAPVSIILILMCVATWRQLRAERLSYLRQQRAQHTAELTAHVSQSLVDRGMVDEPPRRSRRERDQ